jgi:hypothetical protein
VRARPAIRQNHIIRETVFWGKSNGGRYLFFFSTQRIFQKRGIKLQDRYCQPDIQSYSGNQAKCGQANGAENHAAERPEPRTWLKKKRGCQFYDFAKLQDRYCQPDRQSYSGNQAKCGQANGAENHAAERPEPRTWL